MALSVLSAEIAPVQSEMQKHVVPVSLESTPALVLALKMRDFPALACVLRLPVEYLHRHCAQVAVAVRVLWFYAARNLEYSVRTAFKRRGLLVRLPRVGRSMKMDFITDIGHKAVQLA